MVARVFSPWSDGFMEPVEGELLGPEDEPEAQLQEAKQQWARLLTFWTDSVFEVPGLGWRFGLDPIIGLVPIVGDLVTTVLSFYILTLATQLQVPRSTIARMSLNVAIDYVVGAIPLVGNVFDFAWRANHRNMQLLETALASRGPGRVRQSIWDWLFIGGVIGLLVAVLIGSIWLAVAIAVWIARALGAPPV
jgi:hypothetical protein